MNLEPCFLCSKPVLELAGQFDKLDSYELDPNDTAVAQGAFGWCHGLCLVRSSWGPLWFERRRARYLGPVGYRQIAGSEGLVALQNPRTNEKIVLRRDGLMFAFDARALAKKTPCEGGVLLPTVEEMNLELDDPELVKTIRAQLLEQKTFPLSRLVDALGIGDRMLFPGALEQGVLCFDKSLKRLWVGNWVSARAVHARFIPNEVLAMAGVG